MKTKLLASLGCLLLMAGLVHANAVLSFNDNGQGGLGASSGAYTAGSSFTFDITLTVQNSGTDPVGNVTGLSYWFETSALNNSYFKITNRDLTGSPFSDQVQGQTYPEAIVAGGNADDLGAVLANTNSPLATNNSYFVAHLTIQIDPSTPAGTYTIFTTTFASNNGPKTSTAAERIDANTSQRHDFAATTYTITVVPEPATLSLLGLSGLGSLGMTMLRRRRRS